MTQVLSGVSLIVDDYDKAIAFYVGCLGFKLVEDAQLSPDKRWVVVAPSGAIETNIILARASNDEQKAAIGNQGADRVWLFLATDDFESQYQFMRQQGVTFLEEPRYEPYGTVVVFEDLYGNKWDLIQRR